MKRLLLILNVLIQLLMVPEYLYAYYFEVDGLNYNNCTRGGKDQYDWNYDAASNLWNAIDNGTVPSVFGYYFAAGDDWHGIDYTEATHNGDTYEITLPDELGKRQWQGQFHIDTKLTASAEKKYDFYLIMEADNNCPQVTFKLTDGGDTNYFFEERYDLVNGEPFILKRSGVTLKEGKDAKAIRLFFDFGGSPGGTNIKVSKIYFGETANINNNNQGSTYDWNYDAASNLWNAIDNGTVPSVFGYYFAAGDDWHGIDYTEATHNGDTYEITLPDELGKRQWQGQFHIDTKLTASAEKKYDFYLIMEADNNCPQVTFKLTDDGETNYFFEERYDLVNGEPFILKRSGMTLKEGKDAKAIRMFFDFGGSPGGTNIKVSKIYFGETANINNNSQGSTFESGGFILKIGDNNTVAVTSGNIKYSGEVVIPSQVTYNNTEYRVTSIGEDAFSNCTGLTSVIIPNSVKLIGNNAFYGCSNLTSIVSEIKNPFEINNNVFNSDIYATSTLTVPIGTKSLYQSTAGWNKFQNIVEASEGNEIGQVFESDGIYYCIDENNTVSVTKGDVKYSGDVVIPDHVTYNGITYSITSIGHHAFSICPNLVSITIPNTVTYIGMDAFDDSYNLQSVHISDLEAWCKIQFSASPGSSNPLGLAHHLYLNGEEIINLSIPNGITTIKMAAFIGCSSLTSVTIPNSVISIDELAFAHCYSLNSINVEIKNPFIIDENIFLSTSDKNIYATAILTVPTGTKSLYRSTAGWNKFQNIVEAGGEEPDLPGQIHINDIYYKVTESGEAEVVSVEEGEKSVSIPSAISHNNKTYKVTSIAKEVFENREHLAAVIWEPEAQFNAKVSNPNFLLYVKDEKYASHTVKNVVVNGVAETIELADAANGNDFYCPRAFRAKNISYSHNYQMETGLGNSKGWETIVLPFDVQNYTHATKGEIEPFTAWTMSSNKKPFWLFQLTTSGYKDVSGIKANIPYIISMPNNRQYEQQYQIPGIVTFSATNVEVKNSDDMKSVSYQGKTLVPNYANQNNLDYLPLNVNSNYVTYLGADAGSKFIGGLRNVHPFEAYMTTTDGTRSIDVMDGMTTAIKDIYMIPDETEVIRVYDTKGVLLKTVKANDDLRRGLAAGIYIVNGKKMIIK